MPFLLFGLVLQTDLVGHSLLQVGSSNVHLYGSDSVAVKPLLIVMSCDSIYHCPWLYDIDFLRPFNFFAVILLRKRELVHLF